MSWVVSLNTLLIKLLAQLATTLGFGCMLVEAWGTFVGPTKLVGPFAAAALVLIFSAFFTRRLVG